MKLARFERLQRVLLKAQRREKRRDLVYFHESTPITGPACDRSTEAMRLCRKLELLIQQTNPMVDLVGEFIEQ